MRLKIGYFADGAWSHLAFEKLIADEMITIAFICVRYDTEDSVLKEYAQKYGITYLKDANVNSRSFLQKIEQFGCDLFVSMSFNQIFKKEIINLTPLGTINCHAGKLPFYRGRNILNWALINDEKEFGITVHFMDEGVDTGDIILQRCFEIRESDTYKTLLEIAYVECANILYDALRLFIDERVERQKQSDIDALGSYCSQRKLGDEILHWNQSSRDIFNFVRAISRPGPEARAFLHTQEMKINRVEYFADAVVYKGVVGAILQKDLHGFLVKTADSFVRVVEYSYDGEIRVGDRFELR